MTLPTDPKERKKLQLWTFMFGYFVDAWLEVVRVARIGNDQHNPGEPLHWARGKSTDQMNAAFNHLFDYGMGGKKDTDGAYHLAKAIWRLSAQLQLDLEAERLERREADEQGATHCPLADGAFPLYGPEVSFDTLQEDAAVRRYADPLPTERITTRVGLPPDVLATMRAPSERLHLQGGF